MSEEKDLSVRDLLNEHIVRDLILFLLLFFLVMNQEWENVLLLIFPLVSFSFSFVFSIINANKWRTEFESSHLIYNPLGSEKRISERLQFCTLAQLILLFWIGAESFYRPQLMDDYYFYFISVFVFLYTFGFFWMFLDMWKHGRTEIDRKSVV